MGSRRGDYMLSTKVEQKHRRLQEKDVQVIRTGMMTMCEYEMRYTRLTEINERPSYIASPEGGLRETFHKIQIAKRLSQGVNFEEGSINAGCPHGHSPSEAWLHVVTTLGLNPASNMGRIAALH